MKSLFFLIILIPFNFSFGQEKKGYIAINLDDCNNSFEYLQDFITLELVRDKTKVNTIYSNEIEEIYFDDLDSGLYHLVYRNKGNYKIFTSIQVTEVKRYNMEVCLDEIKRGTINNKSLIERIENNQSYSINFNSQGCFSFSQDTLEISRINNEHFIIYQNNKTKVSPIQYEIIRKFEETLYAPNFSWGCTSIDYYSIIFGRNITKITDSSCEWNGFDKLLIDLKIK